MGRVVARTLCCMCGGLLRQHYPGTAAFIIETLQRSKCCTEIQMLHRPGLTTFFQSTLPATQMGHTPDSPFVLIESRPHRFTATVSGQAPSLASRCACRDCRAGRGSSLSCRHRAKSRLLSNLASARRHTIVGITMSSAADPHLQNGLRCLCSPVHGRQRWHAVRVHGVDVAPRGQHACGRRAGDSRRARLAAPHRGNWLHHVPRVDAARYGQHAYLGTWQQAHSHAWHAR